jgi:hypothetical protein
MSGGGGGGGGGVLADDDAIFVGVDILLLLGPLADRFGVTVLFADAAIPYALAGTIVVVTLVVVVDDFVGLGSTSPSSFLLL